MLMIMVTFVQLPIILRLSVAAALQDRHGVDVRPRRHPTAHHPAILVNRHLHDV
jgi:hypothetical protein